MFGAMEFLGCISNVIIQFVNVSSIEIHKVKTLEYRKHINYNCLNFMPEDRISNNSIDGSFLFFVLGCKCVC
jgi:hypothetical protein